MKHKEITKEVMTKIAEIHNASPYGRIDPTSDTEKQGIKIITKALKELESSSRIIDRLNEKLEINEAIAAEVAKWWAEEYNDDTSKDDEIEWIKNEAAVKAKLKLIRSVLRDDL